MTCNLLGPFPEFKTLIKKRLSALLTSIVLFSTALISQVGNVGIGTTAPGSLLHLYSTVNSSRGISIGAQGTQVFQQAYLELITLGDGTSNLGLAENKGWHITGRGAAFGGISQQNDLIFANWNGSDWSNVMYLETTGNVGIGTSNPLARFHVQDSCVLFTGTLNLGSPSEVPMTGAGTRMFWYPDKAAFRAGYVRAYNWDKNYIGAYSISAGYNTMAFGLASVSLGYDVDAAGDYSTAFGAGTNADGHISTAFGLETNAQSYNCFSIGRYNVGAGNGAAWVSTDPIFEIGIGTGSSNQNRANAMTVLKNGNVGIGVSSPDYTLHVTSNLKSRSGYFFNAKNSTAGTYGLYAGAFGIGSGDKYAGSFEASGGSGTNYGVLGRAQNGNINVGVYGNATGGVTNWAGYFNNGYVIVNDRIGIGTTNPQKKLHISGGDIEINDNSPWIYLDNTGTGNSGMYFQNTGITNAQIYYNGVNDYLYLKNTTSGDFIALDNAGIGINTTSPGYDLHFVGNSTGDIAELYNSNTGTNADVLRTKVNKTTPTNAQYFVRCVDGGNGSDGGVRASGSGGVTFVTTSDRRLKTNIVDFSGALGLLDQIQPREYEFKKLPNVKRYGFIAQELKAVYPIAVVGDENSDPEVEPMMIDYSRLTPLLAGATKELHQKVKDQQREIDALKRQLKEIKRLIEVK